MKSVLLATLVVGLALVNVQAASWIVWPGQSLQTAITNAAAGDNITIKEGTYVENITLTKGLDIRGEVGKELTTSVQGSWGISNAVGSIYLRGFKIGVSVTGNVSIANCTDVRMDYITVNPGWLLATGTKLYLYRSSISSDMVVDGGQCTIQKSTIGGSLASSNVDTKLLASTVTGAVYHYTYTNSCTVFQSTVGELLTVNATNYWIGYNTIRYASFTNGGGTCEIVGNRFIGRNAGANGLTLLNTSPYVRNNVISNYFKQTFVWVQNTCATANTCNGIVVIGGNPVIANNVITGLRVEVRNDGDLNFGGDKGQVYKIEDSANGIFVVSGNARILNCIISTTGPVTADGSITSCGSAVHAGSAVEVKYCNSYGSLSGFDAGCTTVNCINANALLDTNLVLQAGSPCINTGAPEPEFNDLDGSRNDMGIYGGHAFDPNGRTTTNPVVMATSASPLYVKRGQNVMLKARGAVAAP